MILISEWFPNPTGNDVAGEFVELYNNGNSPVNLSGWSLMTAEKKRAGITGTISPNGYLEFTRKQTKLVLKNSDESIALYDQAGRLVDHSSFAGSAPEGKSFNRVLDINVGQTNIQDFAWGDPTPGVVNHVSAPEISTGDDPLFGIAINSPRMGLGFFSIIMVGVATLLAGLILYIIKTNEDLSDIFLE